MSLQDPHYALSKSTQHFYFDFKSRSQLKLRYQTQVWMKLVTLNISIWYNDGTSAPIIYSSSKKVMEHASTYWIIWFCITIIMDLFLHLKKETWDGNEIWNWSSHRQSWDVWWLSHVWPVDLRLIILWRTFKTEKIAWYFKRRRML